MRTRLLYLIGEPASGKTTLSRLLIRRCPIERVELPIKHEKYSENAVQLGWDRETFGGTDSLGMAIQPKVMEWLETRPYRYIFAEGDRLANAKFFDWCLENEISLTVAALVVPEEILAKRRKKRNDEIGKAQNETWLRTRQTKVNNLIQKYVNEPWILDGTLPKKELLSTLYTHPVGRAIRKSRIAKQSS